MSAKNAGKCLTIDLVFTKTKSDSLHNIKNLNLWGNDLEDLSLIQKMPNLEVVSLSVNQISSLKDFTHCTKLQELYLRKNNISDLNEIRYLTKLPNLKVLWLHDNPCAQLQNYRQTVIRNLPYLIKLDNNPVNPEDRVAASHKIKSHIKYEQPQRKYQPKQPTKQYKQQQIYSQKNNYDINRNQNILMAVLSLMKELDQASLQIVRRQAENILR